jgi:hypothetical protein
LIASLPNAFLLHIFQLLCDSCGPDKPGTCLLVPVCKQWRDLASNVKGLRVLFQGSQQQQVASFRAWCRRHAGQVVALAITSADALGALLDMQAAAATMAAAARGPALPLQRLLILDAPLVRHEDWANTLQPLLGTLPDLRHLHLPLTADDSAASTYRDAAAANILAPLQHNTSLTSLVLEGGVQGLVTSPNPFQELSSSLPPTLRSLTWHLRDLADPQQLSFDHLTALTHLSLTDGEQMLRFPLRADTFTALKQLRKLELEDISMEEDCLVAVKDQLVFWSPSDIMTGISNLTHLRSLAVVAWEDISGLLGMAPPVKKLQVDCVLEIQGGPTPVDTPWTLQHYKYATQLVALDLVVRRQMLPLGLLSLTQLQQLQLTMYDMDPTVALSWAAALPGLVNLQLLVVPAALTACWHPWLTGLTKLEVLQLGPMAASTGGSHFVFDMGSAAAHVGKALASYAGGSSSHSSRGSVAEGRQVGQLQVLCIAGFTSEYAEWRAAAQQLYAAVVAAVPVRPPGVHLFKGSWRELQECGVELWPAPVAARLQQLVL